MDEHSTNVGQISTVANKAPQRRAVANNAVGRKVGFTLVQKIAIAMISLVTILGLSLGMTLIRVNKVESLSEEIIEHRLPLSFGALTLNETLISTYNALTLYLLTDDKFDKRELIRLLTLVDSHLETMKVNRTKQGDAGALEIESLNLEWADLRKLIEETVNIHEDEQRNFPVIRAATENLNPLSNEFNSLASELIADIIQDGTTLENNEYLRELESTRYYWVQMTNNLRLYFASRSTLMLDNVWLYLHTVKEKIDRLEVLQLDIGFGEANSLQEVYSQYTAALPAVLTLGEQGKWRQDILYLQNDVQQALLRLKNQISLIAQNEVIDASKTAAVLNDNLDITKKVNIALLVTGIVAGLLLTILLGSTIRRRLNMLTTVTKRISEGVLSARAAETGNDEITNLARSFNIMTEQLQRSTLQLESRVEKSAAELETTQEQLLQSEKLASIGQLAAGVAHEINNPIGFINSNLSSLQRYVTGMLELLAVYTPTEQNINDDAVTSQLEAIKKDIDFDYLKDDVTDLLSESMDGIGRVKQIIQDLKDFSRVDSAEFELANLHDGIDSTLNIVNNEIKYKAEVIKQYGELPDVECVQAQLNQVFMNLLVNAAHAIEERGTITISTGTESDDRVWIKMADTGKGISQENLSKIFDPFFTTKPIGKGTGLGLSLSYGIIQKHGGKFDVESEVGKGTTFIIRLPVNKVAASAEIS